MPGRLQTIGWCLVPGSTLIATRFAYDVFVLGQGSSRLFGFFHRFPLPAIVGAVSIQLALAWVFFAVIGVVWKKWPLRGQAGVLLVWLGATAYGTLALSMLFS